MKKILVASVLFIFIGCGVCESVDYSLTNTEKSFLRNIFAPQYPIDSVEVNVERCFILIRGKCHYSLSVYTSIPKDSIDRKLLQSKVDSLACFIADFTKNNNMPLEYFSLSYNFVQENAITLFYKIDGKNRPVLFP